MYTNQESLNRTLTDSYKPSSTATPEPRKQWAEAINYFNILIINWIKYILAWIIFTPS